MIIRRLSKAGIAFFLLLSFLFPGEAASAPGARTASAKLVAVHDGDTLSVIVGRKKERVRLIGIDAPELAQRPWGGHAKRHLKDLLGYTGTGLTLEFDVEKRDRYGRLLAYVRTGDNALVNLEMVRDGYAVLYTFPPNVKYVDLLREGQRYAREKGLGIWGRNGLKEMPKDYRREHPRH
jgi:micrococcal nuclease